ncbi:MAG: hypothetical protein JWO42_2015 [Chloroflexi bacterium]|nr:hypothetical protein [Chloroflexota bacterium]
MAEGKHRRPSIVSAGRSAVALLRTTGHRAKLGSLHLPISLHPLRQQPIVLPSSPLEPVSDADEPRHGSGVADTSTLHREVRALRSRLAVAERRNARLRHALQRERLAFERANAMVRNPASLIDHLVADLSADGQRGEDALRQTVTSVLGAYGFGVTTSEPQEVGAPPAVTASATPSIPGVDRPRLQAITKQLLDAQPEIGSPRYVQLPLDALAQQGALTQAQIAKTTNMGSPLARRRLRLALEGLCRAGVTRFDGSRYHLSGCEPGQDR